MTLHATPVPYFPELANAPEGGEAAWLRTVDDVQIRVVSWTPDGTNGTVLLFPGRTEYAEKYGPAARDLAARGYATLTIDWRGQGLADRFLAERGIGHVHHFHDYQLDVAAMVAHARKSGLPEPYYLIAHSMGGCIGLRSLIDGLDVKAAVFTGPMWGIGLSPMLRPVAWGLSSLSRKLGMSGRIALGQSTETYVLREAFEANTLTNNQEMFDWLTHQLTQQPDLALGGPSMHWLNEALLECRRLSRIASPDLPCLTFLGADESIVDTDAIHDRMKRWPKGELIVVPGAQHEVMMEGPAIRDAMFDKSAALFQSA